MGSLSGVSLILNFGRSSVFTQVSKVVPPPCRGLLREIYAMLLARKSGLTAKAVEGGTPASPAASPAASRPQRSRQQHFRSDHYVVFGVPRQSGDVTAAVAAAGRVK